MGLAWLCREELTFEMLTLEPRASDDETLESEASIGTADSSENLNFDSEGAISDRSGKSSCSWVYDGVVWVGRDLPRSCSPSFCHGQGHLAPCFSVAFGRVIWDFQVYLKSTVQAHGPGGMGGSR